MKRNRYREKKKAVQRSYPEWRRILRKMKYAFDCLSTPAGIRRDDEELDKVQEGLDLFARYFRSLWY